MFAVVYFISIFARPVLMGLALWRSQSVPRWLAVLFFAGLELAQQLGSIGPVRIGADHPGLTVTDVNAAGSFKKYLPGP